MKKYDLIICGPYLNYLNLIIASVFYGLKKTIYFGIGVTASYKNNFNSKPFITKLLSIYLKQIGAAIFYSQKAKDIHKQLGVPEQKIFVANNTCLVNFDEKITMDDKEHLLFVGTLYQEKGISDLLESYLKVYQKHPDVLNLKIVGDGSERDKIMDFIQCNNLSNKVELLGAIYDEERLANLFQKSVVCVSPKQAGLTVLKSMGYGVAIITEKNAITGGEIFNIENRVNGILYQENELYTALLDIYHNREKYLQMGMNGRNYYLKNASIDNMISGFVEAIEYVKRNLNEKD